MGYLLLFCSVISISGVNIIDKVLSKTKDKSLALLVRYSLGIIVLLIIEGFFERSPLSPLYYFLFIGLGVLNYLINIVMYKWLEKIHTGVFFMIGYLYLIFLFFINISLFWETEALTATKIIFGISFVATVFYIMYISGDPKKKSSYIGYILALLCALGWTISFGISAYAIKTLWISPITTLLYETLGSCLFWVIIFLKTRRKFTWKIYTLKELIPPMIGWSLMSLGLVLFLSSYLYLPANIVNIVSLSDLLMTTFFGWILLHEKIEKRVLILWFFAFILLIGFSIF